MNQTWKLRVQEPASTVIELSEVLKIPQFAAQILLQKGIDSRSKAVSFSNRKIIHCMIHF